ncbi:MAG: hypothetical protein L6265_11200, partial [Thermoplasmatales archaeon]|nr:hypothetical protein [Thermoplasmatales archaeon]
DVAKQGTVEYPGAGDTWKDYNIDAVVLVSYDRRLLYDSFSLIQKWSGIWSGIVDDSDYTDYYFGDEIIVNNDEFVSLENIIEHVDDDASMIEATVVSTEYSSTPSAAIHDAPVATFDDTIIAKKYQYEQPDGETVDVYEANIYTRRKESETADSISGSIDVLTFTGTTLVNKVYVARAISSGSLTQKLPQIKLVTTTWSRISTGLTVVAVAMIVFATTYEMIIAYQEGDYLRMTVIGVTGALFTMSVVIMEKTLVTLSSGFSFYWGGVLAGAAFSVLSAYCAYKWWEASNAGNQLEADFYRDRTIAYAIDAGICMFGWVGPIPVGIIAEGIVGGVSWLLNYAGVIDQTYTIGSLVVSAWYALWGLPDPEQQMEYAENAFSWLSDWMSSEDYPCVYVGSTP